MAKKARDIITASAERIGENDSIVDSAKRLTELNIESMPICGEDNRAVCL